MPLYHSAREKYQGKPPRSGCDGWDTSKICLGYLQGLAWMPLGIPPRSVWDVVLRHLGDHGWCIGWSRTVFLRSRPAGCLRDSQLDLPKGVASEATCLAVRELPCLWSRNQKTSKRSILFGPETCGFLMVPSEIHCPQSFRHTLPAVPSLKTLQAFRPRNRPRNGLCGNVLLCFWRLQAFLSHHEAVQGFDGLCSLQWQ